MYPMQAIARRKKSSQGFNLLPMAATASMSSSAASSSSTGVLNSNACSDFFHADKDGKKPAENDSNAADVVKRSSSRAIINSIGMNDTSMEPLLTRPPMHSSRGTKLFVPAQIHAGEVSMQHVVFTHSKEPFVKISNEGTSGLCMSSLLENPSFLHLKKNISKTTAIQTSTVCRGASSSSSMPISSILEKAQGQARGLHTQAPHTAQWHPDRGPSSAVRPPPTQLGNANPIAADTVGYHVNVKPPETLSSSVGKPAVQSRKAKAVIEKDAGVGLIGGRNIAQPSGRAIFEPQQYQQQQRQLQFQQQQTQQYAQQKGQQQQEQSYYKQQQLQQQLNWNAIMERCQGSASCNRAVSCEMNSTGVKATSGPLNHESPAHRTVEGPGSRPAAEAVDVRSFEKARSHFFGASGGQGDGPTVDARSSSSSNSSSSSSNGHGKRVSVAADEDCYRFLGLNPLAPPSASQSEVRLDQAKGPEIPLSPIRNSTGSNGSPKSRNSDSGYESSAKKRKREKLMYVNYVKRASPFDVKKIKAPINYGPRNTSDHLSDSVLSAGDELHPSDPGYSISNSSSSRVDHSHSYGVRSDMNGVGTAHSSHPHLYAYPYPGTPAPGPALPVPEHLPLYLPIPMTQSLPVPRHFAGDSRPSSSSYVPALSSHSQSQSDVGLAALLLSMSGTSHTPSSTLPKLDLIINNPAPQRLEGDRTSQAVTLEGVERNRVSESYLGPI